MRDYSGKHPLGLTVTQYDTGVVDVSVCDATIRLATQLATERNQGRAPNMIGRELTPENPSGTTLEIIMQVLEGWPVDLNLYPHGDGGVDARVPGHYQLSTIDMKCHAKFQSRPYLYTYVLEDFVTDYRVQASRLRDNLWRIWGYTRQEDFQALAYRVEFRNYGDHMCIKCDDFPDRPWSDTEHVQVHRLPGMYQDILNRHYLNNTYPGPAPTATGRVTVRF